MIPEELKTLKQWVCWNIETRDGKQTKPLYIPGTKQNAKANNPKTWRNFITADKLKHKHKGIGFVFTPDDPYCGIDLDHCISETGEIELWALDMLSRFNSYSEVSPSGSGIHIIVKARLSGTGTKKSLPGYPGTMVEIYDRGRYFTITGNQVNGYKSIQDRQSDVNWLYNLLKDEKPKEQPKTTENHKVDTPYMANEQILDIIRASKQADKFDMLFSGSCEGYGSDSEADMALCGILAFYTQDFNQIVSIIQDSILWDEKWERKDYQEGTIGKVLSSQTETYKPGRAYEPPIKEPDKSYNYFTWDVGHKQAPAYVADMDKTRIKTGYYKVDKDSGGLGPGEVGYVMAFTGVGKTALAQSIQLNVLEKQGIPSLLISLEMTNMRLYFRMVAMLNNISPYKIEQAYRDDNVDQYLDVFQTHQYEKAICVDPGPISVSEIDQIYKKCPVPIGLVIIDYIGLIRERGQSPYERMSNVSASVVKFATDNKIAVLGLVQTNRVGKNGVMELGIARDSGLIEADARMVLGLSKGGNETEKKFRTLHLLKATHGYAGGSEDLMFLGESPRLVPTAR